MTEGDVGAANSRQPLDEVMMAMDVVDTLRRRERLVETELSDANRRAQLKDRLREIYEAQGIEVPDRILEEGVAALAEDRFVFDPPQDSLSVRMANLYVSRGRWGKWLLAGLAIAAVFVAVNYFTVTQPNSRIGSDLTAVYEDIQEITTSEEALSGAGAIMQDGRDALSRGDADAAREALNSLEALRALLNVQYSLQIVNRPDELSGVWRVPDVNTNSRNYYLIVEAVDRSGRVVAIPVRNEETGNTQTVSTWGLRVDQNTFESVADDKLDDGIIQNNIVGEKPRGALEPEYTIPTSGGAITAW
ncbi:DUF6384 family protein [Defluviimonas sp. D31]|uniref:DUF6384 family protein n=1 Tax=Defluviimonas sp. D31 TaxID=3083253 RepID=UPI00296E5BC3|nr:DUF6384 family protein [Defluviimonas sp. D31]MDW4550917.1 DUF6384 family protein [Defluviimonas sp. D31]